MRQSGSGEFKDQVVLVTGGTGSWGHELTRQLLEKQCREVRLFARNELSHVHTARKFNDKRVVSIVGDVRDYEAVEEACRGVDTVFHLAALKHVPVCQHQPFEAVKTNILGTNNLIEATRRHGVGQVVLVSTDKAVAPYNLYGMTKGVAESLTVQANEKRGHTKFVCIRGGNVLGSNGSVVPLFIQQIRALNKVTITDPSMTRFYLTLSEAIGLLFEAASASYGGEVFVMNMPACNLGDLADVLIERYGNADTTKELIGVRPGEKKHEVLISEDEAPYSYQWGDHYFVILPQIAPDSLRAKYAGRDKMAMEKFASNCCLMSKGEIRSMLERGGFLS